MRYLAVAIIWLVLLLVGVYWKPGPPGLAVALHKLEVNHLLQPGDLKTDETTARYLIKEVAAGQPVPPESLAGAPLLAPRVLVVTIPVRATLVREGLVNAN